MGFAGESGGLRNTSLETGIPEASLGTPALQGAIICRVRLGALDGLLGDLGEGVEAWGPRRGWELESWIEPSGRKFVKEGTESGGPRGRVGSVPRKVCVSLGLGVRAFPAPEPEEETRERASLSGS